MSSILWIFTSISIKSNKWFVFQILDKINVTMEWKWACSFKNFFRWDGFKNTLEKKMIIVRNIVRFLFSMSMNVLNIHQKDE
jgi:hypothetical protein